MSLPPRHPQTVPYIDESIRRRAAKSSVSFIELLEKSAGYDDDIDSIASSIGKEDQENMEGLEFLESSGYLERKKARRRKRRKQRNQWRNKKEGSKHSKLSSFDLDASYDGETIEVPCYAKLVVSFDAPEIAPPSNPKFLQVQTAWVETPSRPLRKIKVTSDSLQGKKTSYYLPANMDDDDDIYSNSSSSESSRDGDADRDGNASSGSEMMSLHSDASSDGFNNDAIDVEKAFQLDKLD